MPSNVGRWFENFERTVALVIWTDQSVYSWQNLLAHYAQRQGESVRFDYAPCDSLYISSVLVIALLVQWIDGGPSRLQVVDMLVFFCVGANRTKFQEGMYFINCTY